MNVVMRVIGLLLIAIGAVMAIHTVAEPWYYTSTEASPDSNVWAYISPFTAAAIILGVVISYLRKQETADETSGVSWGRLANNALFYGFLFAGILFFANWSDVLSADYAVVGPGTTWTVWKITDATVPLLAGALGMALLRGDAPQRRALAPAVWERWALAGVLRPVVGTFLMGIAAAVPIYFIIEPLIYTSTSANPYSPVWDYVLDPLVFAGVVLGLIIGYVRKSRWDGAGAGAAITWGRLTANLVFYGFLFVGILFFWDWSSGHNSDTFTPGGPTPFNTMWFIIYGLFPLLAGSLGLALVRGDTDR